MLFSGRGRLWIWCVALAERIELFNKHHERYQDLEMWPNTEIRSDCYFDVVPLWIRAFGTALRWIFSSEAFLSSSVSLGIGGFERLSWHKRHAKIPMLQGCLQPAFGWQRLGFGRWAGCLPPPAPTGICVPCFWFLHKFWASVQDTLGS